MQLHRLDKPNHPSASTMVEANKLFIFTGLSIAFLFNLSIKVCYLEFLKVKSVVMSFSFTAGYLIILKVQRSLTPQFYDSNRENI